MVRPDRMDCSHCRKPLIGGQAPDGLPVEKYWPKYFFREYGGQLIFMAIAAVGALFHWLYTRGKKAPETLASSGGKRSEPGDNRDPE